MCHSWTHPRLKLLAPLRLASQCECRNHIGVHRPGTTPSCPVMRKVVLSKSGPGDHFWQPKVVWGDHLWQPKVVWGDHFWQPKPVPVPKASLAAKSSSGFSGVWQGNNLQDVRIQDFRQKKDTMKLVTGITIP